MTPPQPASLPDDKKPCCAHSTVKLKFKHYPDGTQSDYWECASGCGKLFIPAAPKETQTQIMSLLNKGRAHPAYHSEDAAPSKPAVAEEKEAQWILGNHSQGHGVFSQEIICVPGFDCVAKTYGKTCEEAQSAAESIIQLRALSRSNSSDTPKGEAQNG